MATKPILPVIGNDPITGAEITKEPLNTAFGLVNDYAEDVSQDLGTHIGSTSAHLDSSIPNTSNVAGISVKDAINNTKARIDSHVGGSAEKHAAGAITVTPVGSISATEVQSALSQVDSRMTSHVAGTTEKHGSDDVLNESSVVGTNVSTALNTVQQQVNALVVGGTTNTTIGVYSLTTGGLVNAYTGTFASVTLFGGLKVSATFNTVNTGASTFNLNSLGVKSIKYTLPTGVKSDLKGGELYGKVLMEYDGTDFVVVEKNFLNGGTPSTPVTVNQPITSLPSTVVKGKLNAKVEGNTLYQAVINGDFANGTTGWTSENSISTVSSKVLTNTANGTASYGRIATSFPNFKPLSGQKFAVIWTAKVTGTGAITFRTIARNGIGSPLQEFNSPTPMQNIYQTMVNIVTASGDYTNGLRLYLSHAYPDAATANGKVMEVDGNIGVFAIPITGTPYEAFTADQMNALVTMYFEGLQSVKDVRVKSVGKNLFDKLMITTDSYINFNTGVLSAGAGYTASGYCKIKPSTQYFLNTLATGGGVIGLAYYDINKNFISGLSQAGGTPPFTTPSNAEYLRFTVKNTTIPYEIVQLELGSTATAYEPYNSSEFYIPNITLNRLPNGIADEVTD